MQRSEEFSNSEQADPITAEPTTRMPLGPRARTHRAGQPRRAASHDARLLRRASTRFRADDGAATAEYAVATMAAVGFAGLLIIILRGDEVRAILTDLVRNALTVG